MRNHKKILATLCVMSCFGVANAQLIVDEEGKVGIGITETPNSQLSINSVGSNTTSVNIFSANSVGLYVNHHSPNLTSNSYGIQTSNFTTNGTTNYGLYATVGNGGYGQYTKAIGIYGSAGGSVAGFNYGVYGHLNADDGAAVFGSTSASLTAEFPSITGNYAAFFYGNARITGALTVGYVNQTSDYRLKENIRSLTDADGCLNKVMDMNVVEYNMKQREFETNVTEQDKADAAAREAELIARGVPAQEVAKLKSKNEERALWYEEDSPILKNKHYGLIAQELQEIYPNLVDEGQDGFLAINYTEIIPILIRSIQELKAEVNTLKGNNAPVQKAQVRTTDVTNIDAVVTTLYQNTPNPFTESTLIQCDVVETVVNADLYIYDMNGKQIATYPITERGATSITIEGRSLEAGMYLYALIADGQVIDTKRMILTK